MTRANTLSIIQPLYYLLMLRGEAATKVMNSHKKAQEAQKRSRIIIMSLHFFAPLCGHSKHARVIGKSYAKKSILKVSSAELEGQRPGKQPAQPIGLGVVGGKIMSAESAPAISCGFQVMRLARFQRLVSFCIRYLGRCPRLVAFRAFGPPIGVPGFWPSNLSPIRVTPIRTNCTVRTRNSSTHDISNHAAN
jgi:hypothetical protein